MENYKETTLRDYLRVIFRHKNVAITAFITIMAVVIIGLVFKTPFYQARVKMLLSAEKQVESPYYRELMGYRDIQPVLTQSEIVKSNPVIGLTVKAAGLTQRPLNYEKDYASIFKKPFIMVGSALMNLKLNHLPQDQREKLRARLAMDDLRQRIDVTPINDTELFVISVRDFSASGAAGLANILSRAYVIFDLQQQLAELQLKYGEKHPMAIQLKDSIDKMVKNLNGEILPDVEAIGPASVKVIEQAAVPSSPAGLPKRIILLIASVIGIFLGLFLAFAFEYLDPTFKSPQDIERTLNLPCLGSIPKQTNLDIYHNLSEQIYLLMKDRNLKSLLITAALPREGVTNIVVHLGKYMSQKTGCRVLVIDANLRNPAIHKALNISNNTGLGNVLEAKATWEKAVVDLGGGLVVLTAGTTELNPITLLESQRMSELLKAVKDKFSVVLMDCSNLKDSPDTLVLSVYADGVVIIVNEGKTRRQVVKAALAPLEERKANLLGVILNNRIFPIPQKIYERI